MAWIFHVGQRVLGIKDYALFAVEWPDVAYPVFGKVYTVRDLYHDGLRLGLRLEEVVNRVEPTYNPDGTWLIAECCFRADGFRPLDERRIDQFRAHLVPVPAVRQPERV